MVFWNRYYIGNEAAKKVSVFSLRAVIKKLREFVPIEKEIEAVEAYPGLPIIMGDFTNWEPRPM